MQISVPWQSGIPKREEENENRKGSIFQPAASIAAVVFFLFSIFYFLFFIFYFLFLIFDFFISFLQIGKKKIFFFSQVKNFYFSVRHCW